MGWRLAFASMLLLAGQMAQAAACCGGTSSIPSLISGDDRHQVSVGVSHASIIGDAPVQGLPVFRSSSSGDSTQSTRLNAATLLSDRLQAGLEWSVVEREVWGRSGSAQYSGMGDPALSLAYEAWPEWEYSEYQPRGYWFAQLSLPFARSIYDAARADLLDAVGSGLARISTGVLLLKTRGDWDFALLPEIHRTLARSFEASDGSVLRVDGERVQASWPRQAIVFRPVPGVRVLGSSRFGIPPIRSTWKAPRPDRSATRGLT